jgi:hypothetical protein
MSARSLAISPVIEISERANVLAVADEAASRFQ